MLNTQGSSTSAGMAGGQGGAVGATTATRTASGVLLRTGTTSAAVAASAGPGADGVCGTGVGLCPVLADLLGTDAVDATADRTTRAGTTGGADAETEASGVDVPCAGVVAPGADGAGAALPGTGLDRGGCTA